MDFLYRYRSIENLFKYQELENLSIYFAKPDELNDQMEEYMNIVWQGDEIAFKGLFKHYLYVLANLYYDAFISKKDEKIDTKFLPIFLPVDVFERPSMTTLFKSICSRFFSSQIISNILKKLALSSKKFTADEMLLIFKNMHLYAYLVINTEMKILVWKTNPLEDKEYNRLYNEVKNWEKSLETINLLINSSYSKEQIVNRINLFNTEYQFTKAYTNSLYKDKDTYNINILSFEFPDLYIKDIRRILYNNFCIACFSATFQNEPMWAHYANNENGICLRYNIKRENDYYYINLNSPSILNYNKGQVDIIREFYKHKLNKVIYSDNFPEIDFFSSLGCLTMPIINNFWFTNDEKTQFSCCLEKYKNEQEWREMYHKKAKEYICTKSKNWEYEQEYRLFVRENLYPIYEDKQNRIANYKFEDLDAIIFGRKVAIKDKKKIVQIINKHHIKDKKSNCKFYDLYYSTISKQLELMPYHNLLY